LSVQDYCAASLDGYIAELDDTIEWLTDYEAVPPGEDVTSVEGGYDDFYAGVGALVSGSVTYDFILRELERGSEWPYVGKPCWVLSSRKLPVPDVDGIDVRIRNAPVAELCDAMLNSAGEGNLWVVGGGNVASQFADEGPRRGARDRASGCARGRSHSSTGACRPARCGSSACSRVRAGWSSCATRSGGSRGYGRTVEPLELLPSPSMRDPSLISISKRSITSTATNASTVNAERARTVSSVRP
jgi:dihydrofolate reductase